MSYFPDEIHRPRMGTIHSIGIATALPDRRPDLLAYMAPWGRQVDPRVAYAMNGLAWAAGYPMMKNDHPGTTTILLGGIVMKL